MFFEEGTIKLDKKIQWSYIRDGGNK